MQSVFARPIRAAVLLSALMCVHCAGAATLPTRSALWSTPKTVLNALKPADAAVLAGLSGGDREEGGMGMGKSLGSHVPDSFLANSENLEVRRDFEQMLRKAQVL
jgi:hypothetical protein